MSHGFDIVVLVITGLVVGASLVLSPGSESLSLFGVTLPELCMFKRTFGLECLGCGLTRSFVFMGHGLVAEAFEMHKLGPVLWAGFALQLPWRSFTMLRRSLAPSVSRRYS